MGQHEKDPMGFPFISMENMGLKMVTLLMDGYLWPIQSTRCHLFFPRCIESIFHGHDETLNPQSHRDLARMNGITHWESMGRCVER